MRASAPRPVPLVGWFVIRYLYGGKDRRVDLRSGMAKTLERLAQVTERKPAPS